MRQLRAFCHAARAESITRAAELLGVGQPAVSMHVRDLELELEARLFERHGPRVILTPAGEQLLRLAGPLVEAVDHLPGSFAEDLDLLISGELRIAAGSASITFVLPRLLKQFNQEYPGIRLKIRTSGTREALELLAINEVDVATGAEAGGPGDFLYFPFVRYGLVVIAPLDHPLAGNESIGFREMDGYPGVVPQAGTQSRQIGESIARRLGLEINIAAEVPGWTAIKEHVAAGIGISVVPEIVTSPDDPLSVIPLKGYHDVRSFGFFLPRDRPPSPAAERLVRTVAPRLSPDPPGPSRGPRTEPE